MTAPLKAIEISADISAVMHGIGIRAARPRAPALAPRSPE